MSKRQWQRSQCFYTSYHIWEEFVKAQLTHSLRKFLWFYSCRLLSDASLNYLWKCWKWPQCERPTQAEKNLSFKEIDQILLSSWLPGSAQLLPGQTPNLPTDHTMLLGNGSRTVEVFNLAKTKVNKFLLLWGNSGTQTRKQMPQFH